MARPKGSPKLGGRAKGTPNKVTIEIREAFKNLIEQNTPNMIGWMNKVAADNPAKALDICGALAEFIVPKLARTELANPEGETFKVTPMTEEDHKLLQRYLEKGKK